VSVASRAKKMSVETGPGRHLGNTGKTCQWSSDKTTVLKRVRWWRRVVWGHLTAVTIFSVG
jgi:hypothetical protein